MNPTTKALHLIASVALALTATLTLAQRRVTIYADDAKYATDQATVYEATCTSGTYKLRFHHSPKRLEFEFEGQPRTNVDLSNTRFGSAFLVRGLRGKTNFTCHGEALRGYFYGFEPSDGSTPRPVKYVFTIGNDGTVLLDDGPIESSVESISSRLLRAD